MGKMKFSMTDMYIGESTILNTTEQTIPSHDEANYAIDNQVGDSGGKSQAITTGSKALITGSILLLIGVMFVLHFID